jgi:hypothetical protein
MTVHSNLVEVVCDGPDEDTDCLDGGLAEFDYGTAARLRKRMRDSGWKTGLPGGIDRCPRCAPAAQTPPGIPPAVRST